MRRRNLPLIVLLAPWLLHCLSPPAKRVLHSEGAVVAIAISAGNYRSFDLAQEGREIWPSLAGNFRYGLSPIPVQMGVNIPASPYFSQADLYINYANTRNVRFGVGGLVGVLSGGYHLLGLPIGRRSEAGLGFEYLRGNIFSEGYARDIYATWLQFWTENDAHSSIGVQLQYQLAGSGGIYQHCPQPAYYCATDLSDHGSLTMRASYEVRLFR